MAIALPIILVMTSGLHTGLIAGVSTPNHQEPTSSSSGTLNLVSNVQNMAGTSSFPINHSLHTSGRYHICIYVSLYPLSQPPEPTQGFVHFEQLSHFNRRTSRTGASMAQLFECPILVHVLTHQQRQWKRHPYAPSHTNIACARAPKILHRPMPRTFASSHN
jgi:hypothetical protein